MPTDKTATQAWRQQIDAVRREMGRLHPETITPREWMVLRGKVNELLAACEQAADSMDESYRLSVEVMARVKSLEAQWQQPSATSLFGLILSKLRRR